jgi:hypothetical protein
MSAIAAYRTAVLELLSDSTNIIFTNNHVDQGLRWALTEYSFRRPLIRTYQFSVVAATRVHVLPADFVTRHITKVELWNANADLITEQVFYAYKLDEQWMIETALAIAAGEDLQISYSAVHQIDGLDSAAGTTVAIEDEPMIHVGAAGKTATMRALDRIETINMNKDVVRLYKDLGAQYLMNFAQMCTLLPGVTVVVPDNFPEISF